MPFITFHLVENSLDDSQCESLLQQAAQLYAEVLEAPVERIRGLIQMYPPARAMVGGKSVSAGSSGAPYFEFIVLAGRSESQIQALIKGFTDLIVEVAGVERALVRGRCVRVDPKDWCIAGQSAAELRAAEIEERQRQQGG